MTEADVATRTEQVLGRPPRLEPLDEAALGEASRAVIDRMRRLASVPPDAPAHPFFRTLAHQPAFFEAFMQFGMTGMACCTLPARDRELLILRTGWLCGAPYQFGEHVITARRIGVTGKEIERVKQGSTAEGWNAADRTLIRAAEELHFDAMISDETWDALADRLDEGQLVEVPMIVGHYHLTAFVQNTLRFRLNPGRDGLAAG